MPIKMNIKNFGIGIYSFDVLQKGSMKTYNEYMKHTGWIDVMINKVMIRNTGKSAYYIIKYNIYGNSGNEHRNDMISNFKIDKSSLRKYVIELMKDKYE